MNGGFPSHVKLSEDIASRFPTMRIDVDLGDL